jgi:hypothetical protein
MTADVGEEGLWTAEPVERNAWKMLLGGGGAHITIRKQISS